jgi:hypothetical protein
MGLGKDRIYAYYVPLFAKVLSKLSVRFIRSIEPIVKVSVKRSEFTAFLDTYANSLGIFTSETNFKSVICTVGNIAIPGLEPRENITHYQGEFIAGFTNELENGLITILPFFIRTSDYSSSDRLLELITKLAEALDTHKKNIISEPPQWIDEIKLKDEHEAQNEILKLKQQISKKEIILKKQQEYKSILWLKHNELRDVCTRVLDEIGIKTLTNDIGEEDFWILDLNNSVIAMAECKGKDHNIERRDLSLFDEHREARKKDESFPALLIVNTFNKANSLSEKDMPIPSNVIEKACRNNMLITRTLDLIMILNLFQKSMITKENIFEKITKHRGWMRVSDEGEVIEVITI